MYQERFGEKVTQIVNNTAELWRENIPGTFILSLPFNSAVPPVNERRSSAFVLVILHIRLNLESEPYFTFVGPLPMSRGEERISKTQRKRKKAWEEEEDEINPMKTLARH